MPICPDSSNKPNPLEESIKVDLEGLAVWKYNLYCSSFLKFILSKRPEQVNLPGERKQTPLHYAALIDNVDAAVILVSASNRFLFYYCISTYF